MISSQLSQQAKQDFNIVLNLAQSIGLADYRPQHNFNKNFITNTPTKKRKQRTCNHSDLRQFQRLEKAKKVRQRHSSLCDKAYKTPESARKGSVKDVFCQVIKAYQDPLQYVQTQKQIVKNDNQRISCLSRNTERVSKMSKDKKRRSRILGDISEGVIAVSQPSKRFSTPLRFFRTTKTKVLTPRTISQEKLVNSFDYSKFKIVNRMGCIGHLSRQSNRSRKVETAKNGKRAINLHFNTNNKAELIFNSGEESQPWFEVC